MATIKLSSGNNSNSTLYVFTLLMIFCASLNVINKYYYFAFMGAVLFFGFNRRICVPSNGAVVSLLIYSICYLIFSRRAFDSIFSALKPFIYPLFFLLGFNMLLKSSDKKKTFNDITLAVVLGTFVHLMLNYITDHGTARRGGTDFWTGTYRAATGQAALGVFVIFYCFYILFSEKKLHSKIIAVAMLIMVMLYNLVLAGRTLIVMTLLTTLVAILAKLIAEKNMKTFIKVLAGVVIAVIVMLALYSNNLFGIKETVQASNLYNRFFGQYRYVGLVEDTRNSTKLIYLQNFFDFPFGGGELYKYAGGYAHDLLLDSHSDCGIFGFLGLFVFLIIAMVNTLKIMKNKVIEKDIKIYSMVFHATLFFEFFMEPIIAGIPWMFANYCLIEGCLFYITHSGSSSLRGVYKQRIIEKRN